MRLIEHAVSHIDDLAGRYIYKEEVWSVSHPLEAGLRRRQSERGPIGIEISRHQEERREHRASDPTPIRPAGWINEGRKMNPADHVPVVGELYCTRTTWMRGYESRARGSTWRNEWPLPGPRGARRRRRILRLGQRRNRQHNNRDKSKYTKHSGLSFFDLRRFHWCRDHQIVPNDITRRHCQGQRAAAGHVS
jgi:hypothetical protein